MSSLPLHGALRRIGFPLRYIPLLPDDGRHLAARVIARHRDRCELHDGTRTFDAHFAPGRRSAGRRLGTLARR
ncbi:hypothetical protein [Solimonas sp. SE-A11]|uniref:hypothetical protein n=1 Tax=Solimonas sp. SE-A11 TaxID=3054954 RepID=UPI00259CF23D|nr:hypothetical protein [Solimonas sp. SE-A11]MDM4770290.1 hypothetical protein [Solimonas sp. SE-A11]